MAFSMLIIMERAQWLSVELKVQSEAPGLSFCGRRDFEGLASRCDGFQYTHGECLTSADHGITISSRSTSDCGDHGAGIASRLGRTFPDDFLGNFPERRKDRFDELSVAMME